MSKVLIWSADKRSAYELIAKATELGFEPVVAAIGNVDAPETFLHHGATGVLTLNDAKVNDLIPGPVTDALAAAVKESGAKAIFIAGTRRGKEVAPMLGAKLDAAVITLAQSVKKDGDKLSFERLYLGGKTLATEIPQTDMVIATFPTRLFEPLAADTSRKGEVKALTAELREPQVKITAKKPRPDTGVNLEAATIVVGVGRGFKTKDDLKLAFDLAEVVGGQVGCSRPLATDLGWLTDEYWIGLSGKEVKPKVYFAAGISGQIQHTTGIRGSKLIVAINTNKDAPIFKMSDYGIVGDLYKVLPALNAAIKKEIG